ncbi:serine hydrolase domain-containing protein [Pseudoalteromonas sp. MMG024]|uniref:serine hydrolase domain-containing protein n=1 Tax=Pseudoalteromonas sp. MMG024 TaxID=2909980 RepID=UPI001F1DE459|nr:serine hydrolase domain-containing protein [Pseudoalteromonas sp. MMG024]MCF6459409.1 beta-lactamase family protein [Pseudoalteromonas sp. MMG024]
MLTTKGLFKSLLFSVVSLTLVACSSDKEIEVSKPNDGQTLAQYVASQDFSGAVLVAKDGEILLNRGYDYAERANKVENTSETIFRIGSISKQFTTMAVLILEERGLLSLDDTLAMYLNDYPNGDKITLKNLLNMTSGIKNYTEMGSFSSYKNTSLTPLQLIEKFKDAPLEFTPGSKFKYSNSNYVIAGYIIEEVSGKTYAQFIEQEIFQKLSMTNSSYGKDKIGYDKFAQGYSNNKPVGDISMTVPYAAGALVSTVEDLYKWHQGVTNRALISEESTQKMYTVGLNGYALGWNISTNRHNEKFYQHGGGIDGFVSYILRSEDSGYFVAVLANEEEFPSGNLAFNIMSLVDAD